VTTPSKAIAEVALNIPVGKSFHYRVPEALRPRIAVGDRLLVPFSNRKAEGFCVGFAETSSRRELKSVEALLDDEPLLSAEMVSLGRWIAEHYLCSLGEVLFAMVPEAVRRKTRRATVRFVRLAVSPEEAEALIKPRPLSPRLLELVRFLSTLGREASYGEVQKIGGFSPAILRSARKKGLIHLEQRPLERDGLPSAHFRARTSPFQLTAEQSDALSRITSKLGSFAVFLLHGITSSGKTEVYIRAIEQAVSSGMQAIVLVPEISLTPQTILRFSERFDRVAILHSALAPAERAHQWRRIHKGEADVVIGARSAVFAPVRRLGLIVIDEEHETSFKQEVAPRYHARDVAIARARQAGALVLLGSATPSLEAYEKALSGKYEKLVLRRRIGGHPLPRVSVVDMRQESLARPGFIFSRKLEEAIRRSLSAGEQVILFMNRRGFSPFLRCPRCGYVFRCPDCDVSLVFHKGKDLLLCHYCGRTLKAERNCPECFSGELLYRGTGTERIRETVAQMFPSANVVQMDSDTTRTRGTHERLFQDFREGKVQVLVGTQMVAKGLDFPNVTTVGVVLADVTLNLPDFRSEERTFQLLSQVAGRTGRGPKGGEVIIQSYQPDRLALCLAAVHDYEGFATSEMKRRRELGYPPFGELAEILFQGKEKRPVRDSAVAFAGSLKAQAERLGVKILGPAACPLARIMGRYRWHIVCKGSDDGSIHRLLAGPLSTFKPIRGVRISVDVDPVSLL